MNQLNDNTSRRRFLKKLGLVSGAFATGVFAQNAEAYYTSPYSSSSSSSSSFNSSTSSSSSSPNSSSSSPNSSSSFSNSSSSSSARCPFEFTVLKESPDNSGNYKFTWRQNSQENWSTILLGSYDKYHLACAAFNKELKRLMMENCGREPKKSEYASCANCQGEPCNAKE